jgi:hypothetical protein
MSSVLRLESGREDLPSAAAAANPFGDLVRHFFGRFFDAESLSPQGDPAINVTQTLGILAVPSAFFVLLFRPLTLTGWSLVAVRYMFVSYSMIVMGLLMVFEWDALFPDRRDYQILTPLPIRLSTLFAAKAAALGIFLAVFLVDINFFGVLFWPGIDGGSDSLSIIGAHVTAVLAGGLFAALAVAAIQGLLITLFSGRTYRRISICVQTLLMALLVMLLFLTWLMGFSIQGLVKTNSPLLQYFPGYWFVGFYESLRPTAHSRILLDLGNTAVRALGCAAAVFVLTYLPGYRRHCRKSVESPEPAVRAGNTASLLTRLLERTLLKQPVECAVFHFVSQTITRSVKHRLFLATYGGFGAALAVLTFASGKSGLLELPLTLSFVLVSGLRAAFNFPSELRANWAFQVSEITGLGGYLAATRKWVVACAILPLFLLLSPMEFVCFPWTVAVFHLAFGITLSVLLMEFLLIGFRKVPFTCAHLPGKVNLTFLSTMYVFGFTMYSRIMASFEAWLGEVPLAACLFFVCAASAIVLLARWRVHMLGGASVLDYEDPGYPVITTLDLMPRQSGE